MQRVHIIGAGMAGLSAATCLAEKGIHICLYEAAKQAGGRCRSYHDPVLDRVIDNGNHLIIGANRHALEYIERIGASDSFLTPPAIYPFVDLAHGTRWQLSPPFYLPGLPLSEYRRLIRLFTSHGDQTVSDCIAPDSLLSKRWIEPLCVSALNTSPDSASATMLRHILLQGCFMGRKAAQPYLANISLHDSLVEPALTYLKQHQADIYYQHTLKSFEQQDGRITQLRFSHNRLSIAESDHIIFALPYHQITTLLPEIKDPADYSPIVNGHFLYPHGRHPGEILAVTGGDVQWLFFKNGLISTTTSAATTLAALDQDSIAKRLWADIGKLLDINDPLPAHRIVTEKRATFACTPEALKARPDNTTGLHNACIAGDYTDTGLPATIESAITSGKLAAQYISA